MKISYSTMPNLNQQIISNNNKKISKIQIYKLWQAVTVETKTPVKVKA